MMEKVLISTSSFGKYDDVPLEILKNNGIDPILNPHGRKLTEDEIADMIIDLPGLIAGTEPLTRNVLIGAKKLKVISRCGTGLDNVDLNTAAELGIKVYNTPDAPTNAVAELTVGLILNCLRGISKSDLDIRKGKWNKTMGNLLEGKVVGIIGYGRIGKRVSQLVQAFGAKILAYDINHVTETLGGKIVSFDELINGSDVITLHIPPVESKSYIIGTKELGQMKEGAYIINASRGGLIDENALYEALRSGKLAGAGIDTFEKEPYTGKLKELDNVVLTSHIGSYAKEARVMMEKQAVENLLKGLEVN